MDNDNLFKMILKDIVSNIVSGVISTEEVKERVQNELESRDVWESSDFLITDCYYTLKHITEENISLEEWRYFEECFNGSRQYNLEEKRNFILAT